MRFLTLKYGIALVALLAVAGPVLFERHNGAVLDAVETGSGELNRSILASIEKERETTIQSLSDSVRLIHAANVQTAETARAALKGWKAERADWKVAEAKYQAAYKDEMYSRVAAETVCKNGHVGLTAAEFKAKMLQYDRNRSVADHARRQPAPGPGRMTAAWNDAVADLTAP